MDAREERRASYLNSMFDGVTPDIIVDEFGEELPSAARIAGLKVDSALRLFLNKAPLDGGSGKVEEPISPSDVEPMVAEPSSPGNRRLRKSSIVQSMNEYMIRRLLAEDKVSVGVWNS